MISTNVVNLTPHEVKVKNKIGKVITIEPSGHILRVNSKCEPVGHIGDVIVYKRVYSDIEFPVDIKPFMFYIVSAEALKGIKQLDHPLIHQFIAPNTSWSTKDDDNNIISVNGFLV